MHFIMKYIIRIFVGMAVTFMFSMNIIANILLWSEVPKIISIIWIIGTLLSYLISLNYYELIIVKVKDLLMVLATDTIDYYKKEDIHE